jgi:hypothetical protein
VIAAELKVDQHALHHLCLGECRTRTGSRLDPSRYGRLWSWGSWQHAGSPETGRRQPGSTNRSWVSQSRMSPTGQVCFNSPGAR